MITFLFCSCLWAFSLDGFDEEEVKPLLMLEQLMMLSVNISNKMEGC